jgi:sRNA-binding protein
MNNPVLSMLPELVAFFGAVIITYIICKLWFSVNYIHLNEVKPLQEGQYIMQNQYAVLAERIKHAEAQLADTKARLEIETAGHLAVKIQLAQAEADLTATKNTAKITSEQSKQVGQLLELTRKLSTETEALHTLLASQMISIRKNPDEHFTLAGLQKRG